MYRYEFMITTFEEGEKKIRARARHTYTIHAHTYIGKHICKPNPIQSNPIPLVLHSLP
jgi:hypothetical protein